MDANNNVYRISIQQFDAKNYYLRSNLVKTILCDANYNKLVEEDFENYIYSVSKIVDPASRVKGRYTFEQLESVTNLNKSKQYIVYSPLKYSKKTQYENGPNGAQAKVLSETYSEYCVTGGRHGEIRSYKYSTTGSLGRTGAGPFDYETSIAYRNTSNPSAFYVFGLPEQIQAITVCMGHKYGADKVLSYEFGWRILFECTEQQ